MDVSVGTSTRVEMRERIIDETIRRVAAIGPTSFNVKDVCEALGISNSLINHHFGSRDRMLAEITERIYRQYVTQIWEITDAVTSTPDDALRAWMNASIDWNIANSGWALLLNYPLASLQITHAIDSIHRDSLKASAEYNLARIYFLVRDIRRGERTAITWGPGEVPQSEVIGDREGMSIAGTIAWSTHGAAVWLSGRHLPSSPGIPTLVEMENQFRAEHLERLIRLITSDAA